MSYEQPWDAHSSLLMARDSRLRITFLEIHWARRLNFERTLADTTAESYASVKHTDHIDQLRFASDARGKRGKLGGANVMREHGERAVRQTLKADPATLSRGEEAVKQEPLASGHG